MTDAMKSSVSGASLTPPDDKTLEGQRIQGVLGAVAALPGAALVASGPEGAPLFALALVAVAASYVFWILTDAIVFHMQYAPRLSRDERFERMRVGYRYQWATVLYGAASILLTMAGFAGVHSGVTTSIDVGTGFGIVLLLAVFVFVHVAWSSHERNQLTATAGSEGE